MANFCIMRIEKRKDVGSVRRCAEHHLRTVPTPNADPQGSIKVLVGSSDPNDVTAIVNGVAKSLMKRKDAIRCMDVFCGASPEFFAQGGSIRDFEELAVKWAGDTFGTDNIVLAVTHEDESTPHVQMLITPVTPKGKLSASHWLDGPKKLRAMQDSFADAMKPLGLERGVEFSKAKHEDVKSYYGKLEPRMRKAEQVIAQAEEVQKNAALEKAKIATEAVKLEAEKQALKISRSLLKNKEDRLAEREAEVVKKESILQRLGVTLERQRKALSDAFDLLPFDLKGKLAAIFNREKKEPVTLVKPVAEIAIDQVDLAPDSRKKNKIRPG